MANATLPASSVKSSSPAASKYSSLLVYSAITPMASSDTISGSTAIERTPDAACILPKIRPSSFCTSLETTAAFSRIARAAKVLPCSVPSLVAKRPSMTAMACSPRPVQAISSVLVLLRLTTTIHAISNSPCSTAMRQEFLKRSSRSRTRIPSAVMPLTIAYRRLRRRSLSSAPRRSVWSRLARKKDAPAMRRVMTLPKIRAI